jgi:hypothetical protein
MEAVCEHCGKALEAKPRKKGDEARLPRSWKRFDGTVWCDDCWHKSYVLRAVVLPIAGPVDGTWEELRETLRRCWADARRLANWAVTDLYGHDVRRGPDDGVKMPKMPPRYQYPDARTVVPDMDPSSLVSLLHWAAERYRRRRYNLVWTGVDGNCGCAAATARARATGGNWPPGRASSRARTWRATWRSIERWPSRATIAPPYPGRTPSTARCVRTGLSCGSRFGCRGDSRRPRRVRCTCGPAGRRRTATPC